MDSRLKAGLRRILTDPVAFSHSVFPDHALRGYQREPARAIARAVVSRAAGQASGPADLAAVFSRQAGKDELLAQVVAYLLARFQVRGGSIVVALPTLEPQGALARNRLVDRRRGTRAVPRGLPPRVQDGPVVRVGRASCHFVSAGSRSNARGQTASLLLVANEAQDIEPDRWDAVFAPMASSTDAVTLFLGTVWTANTLLARQMRHAQALEAADRARRLFLTPWRQVAAELPAYGRYVERQQALLGADHPFIRTEYELQELDGHGGLFPPSRRAQMEGAHGPLARAVPGETYALLVDVAGEEEDEVGEPGRAWDPASQRDSTAATIVRVMASGGERPRYEVVRRYAWTGVRHTQLHAQLVDLARNVWRVRAVVVDATGVGAGLASFLRAALGERVVMPFIFSQASKSELGWEFIGAIDAGRFKEYAPGDDDEAMALSALFWRQVAACTYAVQPGPGRLLRWSVPDARTHDDLLLSTALCVVLDRHDWRSRVATGRQREDGR